jgi:hypothetical protein
MKPKQGRDPEFLYLGKVDPENEAVRKRQGDQFRDFVNGQAYADEKGDGNLF